MNQQLTMKDNQAVVLSVQPNGNLPLPAPLTWSSNNNTLVDIISQAPSNPLAATVKAKGATGLVTVLARCSGLPDLAVDITIITSIVYATSWSLNVGGPYIP